MHWLNEHVLILVREVFYLNHVAIVRDLLKEGMAGKV